MDDSSDDESFYITQSSTGRRSATTDIDDHLFETTTQFDDGQLQNAVTGKNTEKTVAVMSFNLFEGRLLNFTKYLVFLFSSSLLIEGDRFRLDGEIDGELFEAASLFDSEKARHTEMNKETQNAGAAKSFESLQGRLVGFTVLFILPFCSKVIKVLYIFV
jgi:hypothetical protein